MHGRDQEYICERNSMLQFVQGVGAFFPSIETPKRVTLRLGGGDFVLLWIIWSRSSIIMENH